MSADQVPGCIIDIYYLYCRVHVILSQWAHPVVCFSLGYPHMCHRSWSFWLFRLPPLLSVLRSPFSPPPIIDRCFGIFASPYCSPFSLLPFPLLPYYLITLLPYSPIPSYNLHGGLPMESLSTLSKTVGWRRLVAGYPWYDRASSYPLPAYSEFMPAPQLGQLPAGDIDDSLFSEADPFGWAVSETEEEYQLRPGLEWIARHIMNHVLRLGQGLPDSFIEGHKNKNLQDNPYWPPEPGFPGREPGARTLCLHPAAGALTNPGRQRPAAVDLFRRQRIGAGGGLLEKLLFCAGGGIAFGRVYQFHQQPFVCVLPGGDRFPSRAVRPGLPDPAGRNGGRQRAAPGLGG